MLLFSIPVCQAQPKAKGWCMGANGMVYLVGSAAANSKFNSNRLVALFRPELSYLFTDRFSIGINGGMIKTNDYSNKNLSGSRDIYMFAITTRKLMPLFDQRIGFVWSHTLGKVWEKYYYSSGSISLNEYWRYTFTPSFYFQVGTSSAFEFQFGMVYINRGRDYADRNYINYGINYDYTSFQLGYRYYLNRKSRR